VKTQSIQVKAGVSFVPQHFSPESSAIVRVLFLCAPETQDGILWITEGWRPARHQRDLHTLGLAFDVRIHNLMGSTQDARVAQARLWVARCRDTHDDPRYQFEIHGATPAQFHIHAEFDQR